jgi:hypothetical protein
MESVASQLIEEVTAHAQSDSLDDARKICADGVYLPNNLRKICQRLLINSVRIKTFTACQTLNKTICQM